MITSYNNIAWYERNLKSVFEQNYPRDKFHVIYVDDCSTDGTAQAVERFIAEHRLAPIITLIKNKTRQRKMANLYHAIHSWHDDNAIVFELDGDDWIDNSNVFSFINDVYADKTVWLTYGNHWEWPTGRKGNWMQEIPADVIDNNSFRELHKNFWSALRTYYVWLFKKIDKKDLMWNGKFLPMTSDFAIMAPLCEMAGYHCKFIKERLYVHNVATPLNDHKINQGLQYALELYIRKLSRYGRLAYYGSS